MDANLRGWWLKVGKKVSAYTSGSVVNERFYLLYNKFVYYGMHKNKDFEMRIFQAFYKFSAVTLKKVNASIFNSIRL